jgi:hypothetical protein
LIDLNLGDVIWDDWILRRVFKFFGGVPRLKFVKANSGVSAELRQRVTTITTIPGYD